MAVNPNTSLPNRHKLVLACSGGGKSQVVFQDAEVPRRGVWHVLYDPDEDHPARRFYTMASFKTGLKAAIRDALKRNGGFRVAYCGDADLKSFEAWCALVWAILDGNRLVYMTIEELAAVTETASKASPNFGRLLNRSRKYGGVITATTQRGTEISKTAYVQCATKIVGIQEGSDVERMAKLCALRPEQIRELQPLEYWVKKPGKEPDKLKIQYKPIPRAA
ncbi:hypothetical protein [Aliamphritea ceti]|uniref:hypothetical protein n=1 Tax=Aliamphritea ceti TaxID=1524258 RepID=UPI0021C2D1D9|nr:hypothetical protein [Aliamphritea ceti]